MRVVVTATNVAGDDSATSSASDVVDPAPPVNTALPAISGTPRDGQTLTGDDGTWTGTAPITYTYQWRRCDADGSNCVGHRGCDERDARRSAAADVGHALRSS